MDRAFLPSEDSAKNINDSAFREALRRRRHSKVSQTLRGLASQAATILKTLILELPLRPELRSSVKQQTVNIVRGS